MAVEFYRVRVIALDVSRRTITLRVFVTYFGFSSKTPVDASCFFRFLCEQANELSPLGQEVSNDQSGDETWVNEHTHRFIERVVRLSVRNDGRMPPVEGASVNQNFKHWDLLTHADYQVIVTDPRWLAHLSVGDDWWSASYETAALMPLGRKTLQLDTTIEHALASEMLDKIRRNNEELAPLFDAVLAAPDDDSPRYVCADALQQRGDPRGELIAVQLALAKPALDANELARLSWREAELLKLHGDLWCALFDLESASCTFRRGFIEKVSIVSGPSVEIVEVLRWLHNVAPIRSIELDLRTQKSELSWSELFDSPIFNRVTELVLFAGGIDPETGEVLGQSFGDEGASAVAASSSLTKLTTLRVLNCKISDEGARLLAASPHLVSLRHLELGNR